MDERVRVEREVLSEPDSEPAREPDEACDCCPEDAKEEQRHLCGRIKVDRVRVELVLDGLRWQDRHNPEAGCDGRKPADEDEEPYGGGPPERPVPIFRQVGKHREDDKERHIECGGEERLHLPLEGCKDHEREDEPEEDEHQFGGVAATEI